MTAKFPVQNFNDGNKRLICMRALPGDESSRILMDQAGKIDSGEYDSYFGQRNGVSTCHSSALSNIALLSYLLPVGVMRDLLEVIGIISLNLAFICPLVKKWHMFILHFPFMCWRRWRRRFDQKRAIV